MFIGWFLLIVSVCFGAVGVGSDCNKGAKIAVSCSCSVVSLVTFDFNYHKVSLF